MRQRIRREAANETAQSGARSTSGRQASGAGQVGVSCALSVTLELPELKEEGDDLTNCWTYNIAAQHGRWRDSRREPAWD